MIARVAISLGISATCFPAKRGRCRLSEGQKLSKDQAPEGRLASPKPRSGPEEFSEIRQLLDSNWKRQLMSPQTLLDSPAVLPLGWRRLNSLRVSLAIVLGIALFLSPRTLFAADAIDLGQRYPATLDRSPTPKGYDWTCDENDVWRLTKFAFSLGDQFRVELKSAQVVLGHHESNVLWAAVFPDQPGEIVKATAGQGQHVTSIWLRFHPARLGEMFPPPTVAGPGDKEIIGDAKRLAAQKMKSCWQVNGNPMVPEKGSVTVDLETREGPRRFYSIDTVNSKVTYVEAFRRRSLPTAKAVDRETALQVFDTVWKAFDREYAMFVVKPEVDWTKLRDEFRDRVPEAKSNFKLGELLAEMLAHLKDLHVAVRVDGLDVPVYQRKRPLNANRLALTKLLGPVTAAGHDLWWCVTDDDVGYLAIDRLTDHDLPQTFSELLEKMGRTRGLILDLRDNGGGSEPLGLEIAGSFLDRAHIYARSQYRNGPRHTDLTAPQSRLCGPKDPWHYVAPVVVLQGQRTMSSAEGLVLMLCQCPQVTTMGDRTAGSSGNPRPLNAGAGITVNLPRWNDLDAKSKPFDAIGIPPAIVVDTKPADFTGTADPVLVAALARLRAAAKVEGQALQLRPGAHRPNERPHVVAVTPARGAIGVDPVTEIRIRFDRPMDPQSFHLEWRPLRGEALDTKVGFRLRGATRYEPEHNEFVFPVRLAPEAAHRIEVVSENPPFTRSMDRFFRSADGVPTAAYDWQFRTAKHSHSSSRTTKFANEAERKAHIAGAGRSASLHALVGNIRQRRRALKEVAERVDDRTQWTDQPKWFRRLAPQAGARFWWAGKSRFRADASEFMFVGTPLQVGGDDRQCWSRIGDQLVIAPSESIARKDVLIADPLQSASDRTDEAVINELKLEYVGDEQYGDKTCHRLRSWAVAPTELNEPAFCDWLIDAKTLLPVLFEKFGDYVVRYEFSFDSIDQDLPPAVFQPPRDTGLTPNEPDQLGQGYDQHFLNALDGSAGRISVRWGKTGNAGTNSSGLN
jgi:Peptidase family S41/Tricorn protease C1 domain